jgi:hypothetical protein
MAAIEESLFAELGSGESDHFGRQPRTNTIHIAAPKDQEGE